MISVVLSAALRGFAPEQIAAAKAEAAARFGRDAVEEVTVRAPVNFEGLFAPLNFRAWCGHIDEQARDIVTSWPMIALRQRIVPGAGDFSAVLSRWPAAAKKIADLLYKRAGRLPDKPRTTPLAELVAETATDAPEVIPGLTRVKALELLQPVDGELPAELWAVVGPGSLSLVLASPDADVYHAAQAADRRAKEKGERIVEAKLDFVRQAIRWSRQPIDALLDDLPALSTDLKTAYDAIGGDGAEATSKSL